MISIFESVVMTQPPKLQSNNTVSTPIQQPGATQVATPTQQPGATPVANSAAGQQPTTPSPVSPQQNSSTPKDYLKTAAKIGLGIGGLGLLHAIHHGELSMPDISLPKLSPGFANIGGSLFGSSNSNNEPTPNQDGQTQVTHSKPIQKVAQTSTQPNNRNLVSATPDAPMVGPLSSPTMPGTTYNTNTFYTKHSQNNESRIQTGHMYDDLLPYRSGYYRYNPAHNSVWRW